MNNYGTEDASYLAAGGESGLRQLVDAFYDIMERDPRFATIRHMHPEDLEITRDKLARFLCGWLGGPSRFREKYGPISIPAAHQHLDVGEDEREQWLDCMREAIAAQDFDESFAEYLITQLRVPAEAVRRRSEARLLRERQD